MDPDLFSPAALAELRRRGDPPVDRLFAELVERDGMEPLVELHVSLTDLSRPVEALPQPIRRFLAAPLPAPAWLDRVAMRRAEQLFAATPVQTLLAVFLRTMPGVFSVPSIARTFAIADLFRPGSLERFLPEVAGLVLFAMQAGGLEMEPRAPGALGFQRLRLHHGTVRSLLSAGGRWRAEWGSPVNQLELGLTVCSLVVDNLEGLARLGVPLSAEDARATLESWRAIAHLLGVEDRLLPGSVEEARRFRDFVVGTQAPPPESGVLVEQLSRGVGALLPPGLGSFPAVLLDALLDPPQLAALGRRRPYGVLWAGIAGLGLLVGRRRALAFIAGPVCRWFFRGWMALARRHRHGKARFLFELGERYL